MESTLIPLPGCPKDGVHLSMEWAWEEEHLQTGIPVGVEHRKILEDIAAELGVEVPFADYDDTRY